MNLKRFYRKVKKLYKANKTFASDIEVSVSVLDTDSSNGLNLTSTENFDIDGLSLMIKTKDEISFR